MSMNHNDMDGYERADGLENFVIIMVTFEMRAECAARKVLYNELSGFADDESSFTGHIDSSETSE